MAEEGEDSDDKIYIKVEPKPSEPTAPSSLNKTSYLSPDTAVYLVWAYTSIFSAKKPVKQDEENSVEEQTKSDEKYLRPFTILTESEIKDIYDQIGNDDKQKEYVKDAIDAMNSCLRSLDTIYKGRELNFKENEKLRLAYLASVEENINFGIKVKDFLKSLPSITIGSAGGITLGDYVYNLSGNPLWIFGLTLTGAFLGYLIYFWIVKLSITKKQKLYVKHDYERDLYFLDYLDRVSDSLISLYNQLEVLHHKIYDQNNSDLSGKEFVKGVLTGIEANLCEHIYIHMKEKKITPELWPICETGNIEALKYCPHYK